MAVLDRKTRPLFVGAPIVVGGGGKYRVREICEDQDGFVELRVAVAPKRKPTHIVVTRSYTYDTRIGLYLTLPPTQTTRIGQ